MSNRYPQVHRTHRRLCVPGRPARWKRSDTRLPRSRARPPADIEAHSDVAPPDNHCCQSFPSPRSKTSQPRPVENQPGNRGHSDSSRRPRHSCRSCCWPRFGSRNKPCRVGDSRRRTASSHLDSQRHCRLRFRCNRDSQNSAPTLQQSTRKSVSSPPPPLASLASRARRITHPPCSDKKAACARASCSRFS